MSINSLIINVLHSINQLLQVETAIGAHIANNLVEDGATLQMGKLNILTYHFVYNKYYNVLLTLSASYKLDIYCYNFYHIY